MEFLAIIFPSSILLLFFMWLYLVSFTSRQNHIFSPCRSFKPYRPSHSFQIPNRWNRELVSRSYHPARSLSAAPASAHSPGEASHLHFLDWRTRGNCWEWMQHDALVQLITLMYFCTLYIQLFRAGLCGLFYFLFSVSGAHKSRCKWKQRDWVYYQAAVPACKWKWITGRRGSLDAAD